MHNKEKTNKSWLKGINNIYIYIEYIYIFTYFSSDLSMIAVTLVMQP